MPSGFTAKIKRNFIRVLPFGLIWLLTGWVFLLTETLITGNQNLSPGSAVTLNLPVFIFASLSVAVVGLLIGVVELVVLEKKFKRYSFATKVVAKFAILFVVDAVGHGDRVSAGHRHRAVGFNFRWCCFCEDNHFFQKSYFCKYPHSTGLSVITQFVLCCYQRKPGPPGVVQPGYREVP